MTASAPRISRRLLELLRRLDDPAVPIAETCRRVGAAADELGLPRPSYQRLRVLVHELRQERARHDRRTAQTLLEVSMGARPAAAGERVLHGSDAGEPGFGPQ